MEYMLDIPREIPACFSTTVFTEDYASWHLTVGGIQLTPVQGHLVGANTFDVNNVHEGKVSILLEGNSPPSQQGMLMFKWPEYIKEIWLNTHDRMGFTYVAPGAGWLLLHYPFNKKWQMTVDGKQVELYKANNFFMAAQLSAGEHRILFEYWPHSPLRWLLVISMILVPIIFVVLVKYSLGVLMNGRDE